MTTISNIEIHSSYAKITLCIRKPCCKNTLVVISTKEGDNYTRAVNPENFTLVDIYTHELICKALNNANNIKSTP